MIDYSPHATDYRWNSPQYGAAFYIFASMRDPSVRDVCWSHVVRGGIETAALLSTAQSWSHGEFILAKVAVDLFQPGGVEERGHTPAHVGELVGALDDGYLAVVLNAMAIARGSAKARPLAEAAAMIGADSEW